MLWLVRARGWVSAAVMLSTYSWAGPANRPPWSSVAPGR